MSNTPTEVFAAINNVRGWWSEDIDGATDKLGAEFTYRYAAMHICKLHIVELVPSSRVVWRVRDNYFSFTHDNTEWQGTKIVFEITRSGKNTEVQFTHHGLVPEYECYKSCSRGWTLYLQGSLQNLIVTGRGLPNVASAATPKSRPFSG